MGHLIRYFGEIDMRTLYKRASAAREWLEERLPIRPRIGLVLGSGLGTWLSSEHARVRLPYADIPGFPVSTVQGHAGALLVADIGDIPVLVFSGRFHLYEGYTPQEVTFPLRCARLLGMDTMILTNAAGALNPLFATGALMVITDHINMLGCNPLTGPHEDIWGDRFPDMSQVYCPELRAKAHQAAAEAGLRLENGVYVGIAGPSLETPAETRMYRAMGADAIGMSTVPEAIVAHQMGMRILGLSCLTNKNLPDCMAATSLDEILQQAEQASTALGRVLTSLLPIL